MRKSYIVSLLVLGALVVVQAGASLAAPSNSKRINHFDIVCDQDEIAVITSDNANSFWQVDTSGQTSRTPGHLKELSVRVYEGALTTEPSSDPIFSFEKSYGNRVGQGDTTHCSGHAVDNSGPGPVTNFFDVDVTNL